MSQFSPLPGKAVGVTLTTGYLLVMVGIPLGMVIWLASKGGWDAFWLAAASDRAVGAYRTSFECAGIAALLALPPGLMIAWVLGRYEFPGRRWIDAVVDIPYALPTAVAGIALTDLYSGQGWLGQWLEPMGITVVYTRTGIVLAMVFISMPFIIRSVQPVVLDLDPAQDEASRSLGASRMRTFFRVQFPALVPGLLAGFALAFARAVGEYGSVIFISGNIPGKTEIAPLLILVQLEQYDYPAAASIASVMLAISFLSLWAVNRLSMRRVK